MLPEQGLSVKTFLFVLKQVIDTLFTSVSHYVLGQRVVWFFQRAMAFYTDNRPDLSCCSCSLRWDSSLDLFMSNVGFTPGSLPKFFIVKGEK